MQTNLNSTFYLLREFSSLLSRCKNSSIVLVSSFVGHTIGFPGYGAYAASKAAMIGDGGISIHR